MHICGAKCQKYCFNISRDIFYSVFYHLLQTKRRHHWTNLHNRKMSIFLKRKKILRKEKCHSSVHVFRKAFQISRKKFHVIYTLRQKHEKLTLITPRSGTNNNRTKNFERLSYCTYFHIFSVWKTNLRYCDLSLFREKDKK